MFPFILRSGREANRISLTCMDTEVGGGGTYDDDQVCVAGLHTCRRRRVLVAFKVFSVDDGDDRVQPEVVLRLPLELADLESERCRERRASSGTINVSFPA